MDAATGVAAGATHEAASLMVSRMEVGEEGRAPDVCEKWR